MTDEIEGRPSPESDEGKAIAELEQEDTEIEGAKPAPEKPAEKPVVPPEKPEDDEEDEVKPEEEGKPERPARTPTMVEAYKLKIAEDQKGKAEARITELENQIKELGSQKGPITAAQQDDIEAEIKAVADEMGVEPEHLKKFADTLLKRTKPSEDVSKTLQTIKEERELEKQENAYADEFTKDVLPLLKEKYADLSDQALSKLKSDLKDLAFSEAYAKLPLSEIFKIKEETLGIKPRARAGESRSVRMRGSDVVDVDSIDEETFNSLPADKIDEFIAKKGTSNGWSTNRK